MNFKVAILQKRAANAKQNENVNVILKSMQEAAENKADILLLPECFITGYDLPISYEKSISDDDDNIKRICKSAKENNIGVVLTSFTKGEKFPQNTAFLLFNLLFPILNGNLASFFTIRFNISSLEW